MLDLLEFGRNIIVEIGVGVEIRNVVVFVEQLQQAHRLRSIGPFLRGDVDQNASLQLTDAVGIFSYLFLITIINNRFTKIYFGTLFYLLTCLNYFHPDRNEFW